MLTTIKKDLKSIQKTSIGSKLAILLSFISLTGLCFTFIFNNNISLEKFSEPQIVVFFTIFIIVAVYILYLTVFDILYFEIPTKTVDIGILLLFAANIVAGLNLGFNTNLLFTNSTVILNFLGATVWGIIFATIVILTKEQGMGGGDIKIIILLGLILGIEKTTVTFYLSIFLAIILSIPQIVKNRSYKNIQIPFVPFLIFGAAITLAFNLNIGMLIFY
jgi:prepilin signal peptidase PulO-like enzyme (type II secretory pathway)